MPRVSKSTTKRTQEIRSYLLASADEPDLVRTAAERFGISRQAIHRHLQALIADELLTASGSTRNRVYKTRVLAEATVTVPLGGLEEDVVWRRFVLPKLGSLPGKAQWIAHYAFTEMLNNAIDHSDGKQAVIHLRYTPTLLTLIIKDDGVGIFKKIKDALKLDDERHSMLELTKGKFTTDPSRHSGFGIYFTSRVCDRFTIAAGELWFMHTPSGNDWLFDEDKNPRIGTSVIMEIEPTTVRTLNEVYDATRTPGNPGFSKTHIPVSVARYGEENLVSRSQAKRLLTRVNRFEEVVLDFHEVETIGQAFADEIFRVYQRANPQVHIVPINTTEMVQQMIELATSAPSSDTE